MVTRIAAFVKAHRVDTIIALALFAVAAVPRLTDLGIFLTADEKNWMGRSYEFIRAFKDWRFNDMMQTTHPGVTTMWLSGSAITVKMLVSHIPFSFRNLAHFVSAAQFPIAFANALAVPAAYVLLRELQRASPFAKATGDGSGNQSSIVPIIASLFIALNPILIGYSRVVHVDALLASFLFLAALATMIYAQRGYSQRWLVASAVLTGLAVLTKAPAVFMAPYFGLVVLVHVGGKLFTRAFFHDRLRDFVLWTLIVGLLFVLLWPAILWVPNPEGNVLLLKRDIGRAAITPHHMVEDYTLNPWHYPATLLTRVTPLIQALGALFLIWLAVVTIKDTRVGKQSEGKERELISGYELRIMNYEVRILWLLIAYIFFFISMMMFGAKKGDRYILPVLPALDVLAAVGLVVASGLIAPLLKHGKLVAVALSALAVFYVGSVTYTYHPYAIAYSNPLFSDNLSQELGWGEGLEQVGAWLNKHAPDAVVASWYPEELRAYTSVHVAHINAHEQPKVRYVVLYRNMFGRAPDHPASNFIDEYHKKRFPAYVAYVAGKEFAWVYEKRVFERIGGELVPGKSVGQLIPVAHDGLAGLEILVATYSGKAIVGELVVTLRGGRDGVVLKSWQIPVATIEDDRWLRLALPRPLDVSGKELFVEVFAGGTSVGNAPTVRYTSQREYRATPVIFKDGLGSRERPGDLALRLLFIVDDRYVTEEESKLLP